MIRHHTGGSTEYRPPPLLASSTSQQEQPSYVSPVAGAGVGTPSLVTSMRLESPRTGPGGLHLHSSMLGGGENRPVLERAFVTGLRSIPGPIRAVAKAIHDDKQFDELRDVRNGEIQLPEAERLLADMGTPLHGDDLRLFIIALKEYAQQLKGVNPYVARRQVVGNVLVLTAGIDDEASFAGVSVPATMDAVVTTHAVFLSLMDTAFPPSVVGPFTRMSEAIQEQLRPLEQATRAIAARRGTHFRPTELPAVVVANARLRRLVYEVSVYIPLALQTVLFDAHTILVDRDAQRAWDDVAGRHAAVVAEDDLGKLFPDAPSSVQQAISKTLALPGTGYITIHALASFIDLWGPFVIATEHFYRDIVSGALCVGATPEEASLHVAQRSLLCPLTEMGDRRRADAAVTVAGSHAARLAEAEAEAAAKALVVGSYCAVLTPRLDRLSLCVLTSSEGDVRQFEVRRERGAWQIAGLARESFETIRDACGAYPAVLTRPVGFDENVRWHSDAAPPAETTCLALHRAAFCGNTEFVSLLLDQGNDLVVNIAMPDSTIGRGEFAWTPLLYAANSPTGDPAIIVELLLRAGADPTFVDEAGCTALFYAILQGYADTVRVLLRATPDMMSSKSTDRVLMALGPHHFIAFESDIRCLATMPLSEDIVTQVLRFEYDMDFLLLCSAIIDGKLRKAYVAPDDSAAARATQHPRLCHLADRPIMVDTQHRAVKGLIDQHTHTAICDGSARMVQRVVQHRLFKLSTDHFLQEMRACRWGVDDDKRGIGAGMSASDYSSSPQSSPTIKENRTVAFVGGETSTIETHYQPRSPRHMAAGSRSVSEAPLVRFADDSQRDSPQSPMGLSSSARRFGSSGAGVRRGTVDSSEGLSSSRRRSSVALALSQSDVVLNPRELLLRRRAFSVVSLHGSRSSMSDRDSSASGMVSRDE